MFTNKVKELEKLRDELNQKGNNVYIVNAGRMNHGKSSLFNSLLDKDEFETGDIRVTRTGKQIQWQPGVYLVDTPGLDAQGEDDAEAVEAYEKANMIVFVHTPNVGEFHANELNWINRMKKLAPSADYFWKHFCVVFTFKEAVEEEDLEHIKAKSLGDIKKTCGCDTFPVFVVSNERYSLGKEPGQELLQEMSGIGELRNFLTDHVKTWRHEGQQLNEQRFAKKKEEVLKVINKKQQQIHARIRQIALQYDNKESELSRSFKKWTRHMEECQNNINGTEYQVSQGEYKLKALKQQWKAEREEWDRRH